jgi:hypothetical protein
MTFEEAGLDLPDVLKVIIIGGNVIGRERGARKLRRRVPRKQESLVALVAELGCAEFEDLASAYPSEWSKIQSKREGEYILVAKRELFRNIADLAGRVNEALMTCYRDPVVGGQAVRFTCGAYLGLSFDHQRLSVSWFLEEDLEGFRRRVHATSSGGHVPFTRAASVPLSDEASSNEAQTGEGSEILEAEIVEEENPGSSAGPRDGLLPLESGQEDKSSQDERTTASDSDSAEPDAVLLDFEEDRVTGLWIFNMDGHEVEVERDHGHLKVDGRLFSNQLLEGLENPEQIEGPTLRCIRRYIRIVETEVDGNR